MGRREQTWPAPLAVPRSLSPMAQSAARPSASASARQRVPLRHRLAHRLLYVVLRPIILEGALRIRLPGGLEVVLGDGAGAKVAVAVADLSWCLRIALRPSLAVGEAYMDGALTLEQGQLEDLTDIIGRNAKHRPPERPNGFQKWWRDFRLQTNARAASRRNVAHHYDLSVDFYRTFLDEDLQYSCAYFEADDVTLEAAQRAKKHHLAAKLLLRPGQRVLDIGCGWGGLALMLAAADKISVHGVTLSAEQLATAKRRAIEAGLSDRAEFTQTDYRDLVGPYDRIVSVGMFEHVGRPNFGAYFSQIARLLDDTGVAVVHSIGRAEGPGFTQPWVAKYIFPGGYIPALSEMTAAVEDAGLVITDVEVLRLHYADTIRCWLDRFRARRSEIAAMYDERFCRMWEFYLCISEAAFRHYRHSVFQLQLAKQVDAVPRTRDYIAEAELTLAGPSADRPRPGLVASRRSSM